MENITGKEIIEMARFMSDTHSEEDYQEWVSELAQDLEAAFGYCEI